VPDRSARVPSSARLPGVAHPCARLNYSSPSTVVALENVHLPTTWQESELMCRNNGLLHHNVITAAGRLS